MLAEHIMIHIVLSETFHQLWCGNNLLDQMFIP